MRAFDGEPGVFQICSADLVWLMAYLVWEERARAAHADDRAYAEFVDFGGEA